MADLAITAASVVADRAADIAHGTAGASVTAGQTVTLDRTSRTYKLTDSNHATPALRTPTGVALHAAAAGQPLAVAKGGPVTIGATLTAGVAYYQSDTPGGICPVADVGSGERSVIVGIAKTTSVLNVRIQDSGVNL